MFSPLQQYILAECYRHKGDRVDREPFMNFYTQKKVKVGQGVKVITQSLERLIDRGYMVGYGIRTPKKWFIKELKITREGVKAYEEWQARNQKKLPI